VRLRSVLNGLVRAVVDEADRNPEFAQRLEESLGLISTESNGNRPRGSSSRRTPAILNPIELACKGEAVLRERLAGLDLEQLKDVVADFGMDQGKLVMKWKTPQRIIDRIVEVSMVRAVKGDVFLK
jgi:hypothetical protein